MVTESLLKITVMTPQFNLLLMKLTVASSTPLSVKTDSITLNRVLLKVLWISIKVQTIISLCLKVPSIFCKSFCKAVLLDFHTDMHVDTDVEVYQIDTLPL